LTNRVVATVVGDLIEAKVRVLPVFFVARHRRFPVWYTMR